MSVTREREGTGLTNLTLHYDDPALVVYTDPPGVLQDVGPELPDELSVLVVDLDLVGRGPGIETFMYSDRRKHILLLNVLLVVGRECNYLIYQLYDHS